ncbi:GDP-mannose 4,6-dehydratase [Homoserinibacter sp. YIM 151385]|uniref:GDP-mannose 4,6-dehydratase n=1 Tax=Homoserinibacter sp. YIM 151385 TaxID=2985506 RepID=UPI0022F018F2|nr:GDP-mannose 4,6-dehydratase [Homoserinibacter sp. YIM 151385]WBU37779.1 GDP-mannose 4,6-dehydratase [Homoserinibacter sp. YIM 151385]
MPVALLTGITGQTGGYLAEQLIGAGWTVHGVVRDADEAAPSLAARSPQALLHSGDLGDGARMRAIVDETEPDAVFNLGGISSVAYSWAHPEETARITGLGVAAILDAGLALQDRLGRRVAVVQASSAEIFGDAAEVPQRESTPVRPVNPYGAAKAFAHHLVGVYRGRGLAASACILYNHESPRRPEAFVTRKITAGAARIARGEQESLSLGNLDAVRDWGWAPDYADALRRAAETDTPGDFVVATGEAHTVRDFVDAAFRAAGIPAWHPLVHLDPAFARPADAAALVGDASRAREVLGWAPTRSFDETVAAMVDADLGESPAN